MRTMSVAEMKGTGRPQGDRPREGSKLRQIYDMFYPPLTVVDSRVIEALAPGGRWLMALTDYYGLDIRRRGKHQYWLVGEWFGSVYLDYFQQQAKCEKII